MTLAWSTSNGSDFDPGLVGFCPDNRIGILRICEFQLKRREHLAEQPSSQKKSARRARRDCIGINPTRPTAVLPIARNAGRWDIETMDSEPSSRESEEDARAALLARLSQVLENAPRPKRPRSLQPTPEAAKSRLARLRKKRRLLLQKSPQRISSTPAARPAAS